MAEVISGGGFIRMADILGFPHGHDTMPSECNPNEGPEPLPERVKILDEAAALVSIDRHREHGEAKDNLGLTAELWQYYISSKGGKTLDAHDVAMLNIIQKLSRIMCGNQNRDNYVDIAGYIALAWELADAR